MVKIIDINQKSTSGITFKCSLYKQNYYVSSDKDSIMFQVSTEGLNWKKQNIKIEGKEVPNKYYNPIKADMTLSNDTIEILSSINENMKKSIDTSGIKIGKKCEYNPFYKSYDTKDGKKHSMEVAVMTTYENDTPVLDKIKTIIKLAFSTDVSRLEITKDDNSKYISISSIPSEIIKIIESNYNGCYLWNGEKYYDFEDYKQFMTSEQMKLIEKLISDEGETFKKINTLTSIKELIRYNTQIVTILKPGSVYVESKYGISLKLFKILVLNEPPTRNSSRIDFVNIKSITSSKKEITSDDEKTIPVKSATNKVIVENDDSDKPKSKAKTKIAQVESDSDEPKPVKKIAQVESDSSDSEPEPQPVKVTKKPTKKVVQDESDGSDSEPEPVKVTTKAKSKK